MSDECPILALLKKADQKAKLTGTAWALVQTRTTTRIQPASRALGHDKRILEIVRPPKW